MVMQELPQPRPTYLLKRGAYDAPRRAGRARHAREHFPFPADQPRNRLGLAQWMVDRRNPLTARVVVNRIWRMHFGRGLVATQEDFGSQGRLPSHPELLDWLAGWFMDNGWDVKALHRLIVTSATYRQSSHGDAEMLERDPDNTLLARGPAAPLPAEQIRDSALAVSGLLNREDRRPEREAISTRRTLGGIGHGQNLQAGPRRQTVSPQPLHFWRRTAPPPSMLTFDATSREVCTARRERTPHRCSRWCCSTTRSSSKPPACWPRSC